MKVMMLILETPEDFANRGAQTPAAQEYWDAWKAYGGSLGDKIVGGNILAGKEQATTLRVRAGKRQIQDGPFADSKEALGGYMIFDCESMDQALEFASKCPAAASGAVELRPIVEMPAVG